MIFTTKYSENLVFTSLPDDNTRSLAGTHTRAQMQAYDNDADKDGKVLANETAPNYKQGI